MNQTLLVSRTDRAGDVVLTLPVFSALRRAFPGAAIIGHVRTYTAPLLTGRSDVDRILIDDPHGTPIPLLKIAKILRKMQITAAILVHPSFRAVTACWLAGVPVRVGRASNLWQGLLNRRMAQHRSTNQKHESRYNVDLLQGMRIDPFFEPPVIYLSEAERAEGRQYLDERGLIGIQPVFIHPGHGGSAFNMSLARYVDLAQKLMARGLRPALSLGPGEEHLGNAFAPSIPRLTGMSDLKKVAAVFSHGLGFMGGSTGPMHIAGAVGLPVAAFFPPFPAMTPKRWGPAGQPSGVFLPPVNSCPGKCQSCPVAPCMDSLDLKPAVDWLKNFHHL